MSVPATPAAPSPALLTTSASLARLSDGLRGRRAIAAGNLWGSSQALVLATLAGSDDSRTFLVVCANQSEGEAFGEDLATLGVQALVFPAREVSALGGKSVEPESLRQRLQAAQVLAGPRARRPRVVVSPLAALLEPVPSPKELEKKLLHLQVGMHLDANEVLDRLVAAGYSRAPLAEHPGELSLRGDILDVFPFSAELPLRIELFDQEVESLRTFEPESQRSLEALERTALSLISDAGGVEDGDGVQPLELFDLATVVVEIEPLRIADQAAGFRIQSSAHARALGELHAAFELRARLSLQSLPAELNFSTR